MAAIIPPPSLTRIACLFHIAFLVTFLKPSFASDVSVLYDPGPRHRCYYFATPRADVPGDFFYTEEMRDKDNSECGPFRTDARADHRYDCLYFDDLGSGDQYPTCPTWKFYTVGWDCTSFRRTPGYDGNVAGGNGSMITTSLVNNARDTEDCGLRSVALAFKDLDASFIKFRPDGVQYSLDDGDQFIVSYNVTIAEDRAAQASKHHCLNQQRYLLTEFSYIYEDYQHSNGEWRHNILAIKHFDPNATQSDGLWNRQDPFHSGDPRSGCQLVVNGPQVAEGVPTHVSLDFKALLLEHSERLCHSDIIPAKVQFQTVSIISNNVASNSIINITNVNAVLRMNDANTATRRNQSPTQTSWGQCGGATWTGPTACPPGQTCSPQNSTYAQCTPTAEKARRQDAPQTSYGQCGGQHYSGPTACPTGQVCSTKNDYYAQCTPTSLVPSSTISSSEPVQTMWGQCGGSGWDGPTACPSQQLCSTVNPWYAQCIPIEPNSQSSIATSTTSSVESSAPSGNEYPVYKATFSQYGDGDSFGNPNCNTDTNSCFFYNYPGYNAALSEYYYGAGPDEGQGSACGTCWLLTPLMGPDFEPIRGVNPIVVKINNLCLGERNPLCAMNIDGNPPTNEYGGVMNFDTCLDDGAAAALFGTSGAGLAIGLAQQVGCEQWSGSEDIH